MLSKYKMIDLGDLYSSLNLQVIRYRDNKMLFLNRLKYIKKILWRYIGGIMDKRHFGRNEISSKKGLQKSIVIAMLT